MDPTQAAQETPPRTRGAGVLLHPTSLPGPHGIGDLGAGARAAATWLARAGMRWWQVLPLVPPGAGDSPYSSWSAFAASPWLIDLHGLAADGLLEPAAVAAVLPTTDRVDFGAVHAFKAPRLNAAADRLLAGHPLTGAFEAFRAANPWLGEAGTFRALHAAFNHAPWWQWPAALRDREPKALVAARETNRKEIERFEAIQFFFDRQWSALRAHCATLGIGFIGDLPIYVDADSADVWSHRHLFEVDDHGHRMRVAGVPPDGFSATGQLWGNPLYRWDRLAADDFAWWKARLGRALALHDRVRIDHFRAFSAYWAVPADAPDARTGAWEPGPGQAFFDAMARACGDPLPVIAEDLGVIDDGVKALLASSGLPGMHVLQFAFGGDADNWYLPHNHRKNGVVYPGTHDNDTTLGWWTATSDHVRDHVRQYFGIGGHDLVWDFIRAALASVCDLAVVSLQDVLALDGRARMNTPSLAQGNWAWRFSATALPGEHADRLRWMNGLYGRT